MNLTLMFSRRGASALGIALAICTSACFANPRLDPEADDLAGRVLGLTEAGQIELPLLKSDYDVDIQGTLATVRVRQVFSNPSDVPMQAKYLFPLNQHAAVHAMEMRVGSEVTRAVIQRKAEAEETFAKAEAEGKAAALLTQHRPNMFTQTIANLMPGAEITVTLSYVQAVPEIDGAYELVVPMVVGPRYQPEPEVEAAEHEVEQVGAWQVSPLPEYPPVQGLDIPKKVDPARVGLQLSLSANHPLAEIGSASHALDIVPGGSGLTAAFTEGKVIDNRDFILRYTLGGEEISTGVLSHFDERGGFVSLTIEPPVLPDDADALPRELVFVLDTSGSMGGAPMQASKTFMKSAIANLREDDYFRIIRFSSSTGQFSGEALKATAYNKTRAQAYIRTLMAGGGTEMNKAIRTAFATQQPKDTLRIVVFLSDGYIGNEAQVLSSIREIIGRARIYAFGVGSSVNRYLLDGIAREGRGYARYVDPTQEASDVARKLAADLKTPLLTDIEIDWGGLEVSGVTPARIPDLFDGNAVTVMARYSGTGPLKGEVTVRGTAQGRRAEMPVALDLPRAATEGTEAIPLIWARSRIAGLSADMLERGADRAALEEGITQLGLQFSLQTAYTSFVAVSEQIVNPELAATAERSVPLPMPAGVPATAYPSKGFSGSSAPEPQTLLGLILAAILGGAHWLRRRRTNLNKEMI